jgi:hypothetical protein
VSWVVDGYVRGLFLGSFRRSMVVCGWAAAVLRGAGGGVGDRELLLALCCLLMMLLAVLCGLFGAMGRSSNVGLNFGVLVVCFVLSACEKVLAIFVRAAKKVSQGLS